MPLYEFYCAECERKFERLMSYEASRSEVVCATCHGTRVRKLVSVFARPHRGGADDGEDFSGDMGDLDGGDDRGDDGGDDFDGGCSCGGACTCGS